MQPGYRHGNPPAGAFLGLTSDSCSSSSKEHSDSEREEGESCSSSTVTSKSRSSLRAGVNSDTSGRSKDMDTGERGVSS